MRFSSRFSFTAVLLGSSLLLFSLPAFATDGPYDRASLKGVKAVSVVVEHLAPDVEKAGITSSQVQTDVELRLRQAGLPVDERSIESSISV